MAENSFSESKIKHLEMIESIIERMGNNSFQLKGWAIALVSIIGTLSAQGSDRRFFLLAFIPLFAFWFLDSFYLQLERKYKVLYKNVSEKEDADIDFNMDTRKIVCNGKEADRLCYARCLFSKTEWTFYLSIIGILGILAYIIILK